MKSDQIRLSIPSHPQFLQLIRGVMEKCATLAGFDRVECGNIVLAVDEACSNIIRHSYGNDAGGKIDIQAVIRNSGLEIIIEDYGTQCDLAQLRPRDLDDIRPGGLGIHIMNTVMDSVEYDCSSPSRNQVVMIKGRNPKP